MTFFSLFILLLSISIMACTGNSDANSDDPEPEIVIEGSITMDNNGASEYVVTAITGDGAEASINSPNPEITLVIGGRYTFINNSGASSHPLDFRNEDRTKLLGQSRSSGFFDDDPDAEIIFEEDTITFTLTEQLASELFDYVCSFHPGMNGSVSVIQN
ncbi:MAG: hypothetical protein JJU37_00500 [Balneolaceae bacterium]|nr:hypothetical protein [Balneolaceae bacterium]